MVTVQRKLTHCPHCRAEVETSAKACRYCGEPVKLSPRLDHGTISQADRRQAGWIMAIAFVAGLIAITLIHRSSSHGAARLIAPLQQVQNVK